MNRKEATFVIAAIPVVAAVILVLLIEFFCGFLFITIYWKQTQYV